MKSSTPRKPRPAESSRFVLGRGRGEKISAVEGLTLSERMARLLDRSAGLSGDERRSLIKEQVRRK
jgi:hypothetical protein